MKKVFIIIAGIIGAIFVISLIVTAGSPSVKESFEKEQQQGEEIIEGTPSPAKEQAWHEVLFDIGEWDKNNGETTTQRFQITSDKWRIKWGKTKLTQVLIEVFDSNDKSYSQPFTADFSETSGTIDFEGEGTYYVRFMGGTSKDAGVWDIRVEELK